MLKLQGKNLFKQTELTSCLNDYIYANPMWDKWFSEDIFYIEEFITINNDDYLIKGIPLSIVKKLQAKEDIENMNTRPYLDNVIKIINEHAIEEIDEQIYLQSQYAFDNQNSDDIPYVCWVWKNGYLEEIGECKYENINKLKKYGGLKNTLV